MSETDKKTSDAQKRAAEKYIKDKTDEIKVRVPKGRKDEIKAHAETLGMSVNAFINQCIDDAMNRS